MQQNFDEYGELDRWNDDGGPDEPSEPITEPEEEIHPMYV